MADLLGEISWLFIVTSMA